MADGYYFEIPINTIDGWCDDWWLMNECFFFNFSIIFYNYLILFKSKRSSQSIYYINGQRTFSRSGYIPKIVCFKIFFNDLIYILELASNSMQEAQN